MAVANRLVRETSPYLLQHAHNPVDWYPWGEEAFTRARDEKKPILLSIGYSACHWCHVMEHESFENPQIARLMNEWFISIKVDREERPDVDDVYMKAVQLLVGRGGWPLTVFLTPDLRPFHGGTYFPPVDRHGIPGFPRVLEAVARAYREKPDDVARAVEQLVEGVNRLERIAEPSGTIDPDLPRRAAEMLLRHVDSEDGGLGGAPKFPHASAFQLFLRQHVATGRRDLLDATLLTCARMHQGGLYDQVGGGFHRYSVDARWLVPHFEKMLYDNAQLPRLYLDAYQVTGDAALRRVVEETLDYVIREMRHPEGGFYSATDADSEGEEGKFFTWTRTEVAAIVEPADLDLVCRYWDVTDEGNFEGHSIPHVTLSLEQVAKLFGRSLEDGRTAVERARQRLFAARQKRVPPLRDEKILTSWNGLMIGTLAEAGRVLRKARFVDAAVTGADFVWTRLRRDDKLLHVWSGGNAKQPAFLDDHVFFAEALVDLYEATGDRTNLNRATQLVAALDARFHDDAGGGYFMGAHDEERLIVRTKPSADSSLPSGNAAAAHLLLRLHHLTGAESYRVRAEEILHLLQSGATENPFGYASLLQAIELHTTGSVEVVIVGAPGRADTEALWEVTAGTFLPHRTLVHAVAGDVDPLAPARGRPAKDDCATAYVGRNFTCSAPVTEPSALRDLLT
jgi:hypothetical protein